MENKYKILIFILLSAIVVSLAVALFYFSYKALFAVLLVMSVSVLLVYCLMYDTTVTSIEVLKKKYDVAIFDELEIYFDKKKPQLNPDFKISDLAKELGISSRAIALLIKKKYGINFDEFLNRVRRAELKRLQSLMENEDVSIQILCVKAGYKNAQHYYQNEKKRKDKRKKKNKKKYVIKKPEQDIANDLDIKKKPELKLRI